MKTKAKFCFKITITLFSLLVIAPLFVTLGCDTGIDTVIKEVEVVKEVPVIKEVEVVKEVPVIKEVEIIKEVPVIKEVEVFPEDRIQIYFSPDDDCDQKVISAIEKAEKTLDIAIYSFNRPSIANAVIAAHNKGITVRVIFDDGQLTNVGSKHEELKDAGISVKKFRPPTGTYPAMHNKFAVIDDGIVITGSYNWTTNATTNNSENLVIITSPGVAQKYTTEFENIWTHATHIE